MNTQDQVQIPTENNTNKSEQVVVQQSESHSVLRPLQTQQATNKALDKKGKSMKNPPLVIIGFLIVILGISSGYGLAVVRGSGVSTSGLKNEPGLQREIASGDIKAGTKVGVADEKTFKDSAEGKLEKGGIEGEGSHHLTRPGGDSQTVYITSSVIDLDQFIGRKVKIWGETMAADKAGWFMDAGKLEVLE